MLSDGQLRRRYGITLEEYDAMAAAQDERCAICNKRPTMAQPSLAVDHDHRTGQVRGLLCARCNHDLLGIFGDDPAFYMRAEEYLVEHPACTTIGYRQVPGSPPGV